MGHVLKINPVFKEMIWGGHKLRDVYGYDIPSDNTGECWAISAHKNGDCTISDGEFAGKTLSSLWDEHRELFANIEGDQFPLLVKIIDACNDLSVQVHPNDEYAKAHENSLGKTECWYVLNTDEGTKMVMGHHAKTKEELVKAIENDDYDNLLNKFDIKEGDFFYIENGTRTKLVSSEFFTVNKYEMTGKNTIVNDKPFQLVTVIKGNGVINGNSVKMGDNFVVCADQDAVEYDGTMTVMICTL